MSEAMLFLSGFTAGNAVALLLVLLVLSINGKTQVIVTRIKDEETSEGK